MPASSNFIWLGDGVTMTRSTQDDFDRINADLRDADRAEQQVFDGGRPDALADMESSWTVRDGPHLVCFAALRTFLGESVLSRSRVIVQLTTNHVWRIKVKYVRFSRAVLRELAGNAPPWVGEFWTFPMASYAGAVAWDERILGFHRVREIVLSGVPHVAMRISRKEATEK